MYAQILGLTAPWPVSGVALNIEKGCVEIAVAHDPEARFVCPRFGPRMGAIWEAREPGSRPTFRFRGSLSRVYDLLAPDGGQVIVSVDGVARPKPVPRFDSYCTYERIATLPIAEGLDPAQVHTIVFEVHPDQPDRTPVAFRLKDPATELKAPKYQGTNLRVSRLLLLGELEPRHKP